jgi:adenylosuccinate lyase
MSHLIDKDLIVEWVEKSIERAKAERVLYPKTILAAKNYLLIEDYNKLLAFMNTLEVKDADLDKEIDSVEDRYHGFESLSRADIIDIAKYFFELGFKTQK